MNPVAIAQIAEHPRESQGGVRRDAALAEHNLVHTVERDSQTLGGLDLAQAERLQESSEQDLAGFDRRTEPVRWSAGARPASPTAWE
jgi:hypothetical protein